MAHHRRILFLIESLSVGGAEKALVTILKNLDYSKMDITLMLISKSGDFVKDLDHIEGLHIKQIVKPTANRFSSFINALKIKAIYKLLPPSFVGNYLCQGYDVVIAFCEGFLTKWIGTSTCHCKKIAWVHTDMENNDWPLKTGVFNSEEEEKLIYHNFDEVVAVSKIVANGMVKKFGCEKISVIYNIIDSDIRNKSLQYIPPITKARLNIVSVGRLEYVKGYDLLINAMDILVNKRHLDIHLSLVGDGSLRHEFERNIESKNLQNNVSLAGIQANPYPFVAYADLFVCPSRQEGFNIAILEAMTLGKPILATTTAGPSEILDNGNYGILTDASAESLASSIEKIYISPELMSDYARQSQKRVKDFSKSNSLEKILQTIYES